MKYNQQQIKINKQFSINLIKALCQIKLLKKLLNELFFCFKALKFCATSYALGLSYLQVIISFANYFISILLMPTKKNVLMLL